MSAEINDAPGATFDEEFGGVGQEPLLTEKQREALIEQANKLDHPLPASNRILKAHGVTSGKMADAPRKLFKTLLAAFKEEAPPEHSDPGAVTFTEFACGSSAAKVGKTIYTDGTKTTHPFPGRMVAIKRKATLEEMAGMFKPNVFWTTGTFDVTKCHVVPRRGSHPNPTWPVRARTKDQMSLPKGPGLFPIDNDFAEQEGDTIEELLAAVPELIEVGMLSKGSSGSYITGCTGGVRAGCSGEHVLMALADASDLKHNRTVIHKRLVLAGFDHSKVSAVGTFLKRTAADAALERPTQPLFHAANLADGLTQDLHVEYSPGGLLGRLPDLTKEEEQQYKALVAQKHDSLIPEMEAAGRVWVEKKVKEGWSRKSAVHVVNAVRRGGSVRVSLPPDAVICLTDDSEVTVADILADREKYHNALTYDPIDPEYNNRQQVGIIYTDGRATLFSQAHGGITYSLESRNKESAEEVFSEELDAIQPLAADPEAVKWGAVEVTKVSKGFDLYGVEIADVAVPGGLALADGRVVRLDSHEPVTEGLQKAKDSGKIGAVTSFFSERVIPALGAAEAKSFFFSNLRKLDCLGVGDADAKKAWFAAALSMYEDECAEFSREMRDRDPAEFGGVDVEAEAATAEAKAAAAAKSPFPPADSEKRNGGMCFVPVFEAVDLGDRVIKPGLYKCEVDGDPPIPKDTLISNAIEAIAHTASGDGDNSGLHLRFVTNKDTIGITTMRRTDIYGPGNPAICLLVDQGFEIQPFMETTFLTFLKIAHKGKRAVLAVSHLGWQDGAYVLPDEVLGRDDGSIVFQPTTMRKPMNRIVGGTLEGWQSTIGKWSVGNNFLSLAISCAFAGVLLERTGVEGGGFHVEGSTGKGKSTALHAAASTCGRPKLDGATAFEKWKMTGNSFEARAEAANDGLLVLDEVKECLPADVSAIIYALTNGAGKGRLDRTGKARETRRWRTLLLSSGEMSIEAHLASANLPYFAGQEVRIINLPASGKFGNFDDIHDFADSALFAQALEAAANQHHGSPFRSFIAAYINDDRDMKQMLAGIEASFRTRDQSAMVARGARRFALCALAGELAAEYGVLPWPAGWATTAAKAMFDLWCDNLGSGAGEEAKTINALRNHLNQYGAIRYDNLDGQTRSRSYQGREGWVTPSFSDFDSEGVTPRTYFMLPEAFNRVLGEAGVNRSAALAALVKHELLPPATKDQADKHQTRLKIAGRPRVYSINLNALNDIDLSLAAGDL